MPCYRCGTRQTDPARGASPWKRGVRDGAMVLICPTCQREHDWGSDLDSCPSCGSVSLSRALGETTCKACSAVVPTDTVASAPAHGETAEPSGRAPGLSDEVGEALQRAFRRPSQ